MLSALFTISVVVGGVILFIILFKLLHKREHNKKIKDQKAILADVILKSKLEITEHETMSNYLLAIDTINFVLAYIDFSSVKEEVKLIDIWQVKTVKVSTEEISVYEQKKGESILVDRQVSKLQLEVTLVDEQLKTNLVLYEYKDGIHDLVHVKKRADYWCRLIGEGIQEIPHPAKQTVRYV